MRLDHITSSFFERYVQQRHNTEKHSRLHTWLTTRLDVVDKPSPASKLPHRQPVDTLGRQRLWITFLREDDDTARANPRF